jgi:hypothetical protein
MASERKKLEQALDRYIRVRVGAPTQADKEGSAGDFFGALDDYIEAVVVERSEQQRARGGTPLFGR